MKQIFYIFAFLFITVTLILSEVIVMKNDDVINGKIIKMDEDTITVITKTKEIVIDKENIMKIYYSEKDYEEDRKKVNNKTEIKIDKEDNEAPYIVKVDPPNGAKNVLASRYNSIIITFNEPMRTGISFYYKFQVNQKPEVKWINRYTVQIMIIEGLKSSIEYKIILNDTQHKKYNLQDLKGNIVKEDTVIIFKTASADMEKKFEEVQKLAESIEGINESKKAWLGVKTEDLDNKIKKELNIKPIIRGVIIKGIINGSPAERDGLKKNDIIQSLFNEKISTSEYFNFFINNLYLGTKIKLKIYRNGNIIEQEIILDIDQKK